MKAAVLREINTPLSIEEVQIDRPGPREAVIRTGAAGLCHSDLSVMNGTISMVELPAVLGHESAGTVVEVGRDVTYVQPGDRVITCLSQFCGLCEYCLTGRSYLCRELRGGQRAKPRLSQDGNPVAQFAGLSSFAEELLVHENAVVKVDDDIPIEVAAVVGCGVTTGLGAVLNTAQVRPASTTAVIGLGGVGLAAVQGCYIAGARQIIAVDRWPGRLERARALGATHTVNASDVDSVQAVRELSGGGVDYGFEAVGRGDTSRQAFEMTRPGGMAVIVGVVSGMDITVPGSLLQGDRILRGCSMGSNRFRIDMPKWLDLYRQGRLRLDEFVTSKIKLEEVNEGYAAMERGDGARSVIVFS
jgi:S-(hydroxymethyl)glutathione dehydrogenase / alcohol dehydrogenase